MKVKNPELKESCCIKSVNYNKNLIELRFRINPKLTEDGQRNLARLLTLHLVLKDCRNESNHAVSGKRPGVDEVKQAIRAYIILTEGILTEVKSKQKGTVTEEAGRDNEPEAGDKAKTNQKEEKQAEKNIKIKENGLKFTIDLGNIKLD